MAVNALKTFPSAVDGMPRAFFPSGSYGSGSAEMDMGRTDNAIHQSGMEWAKRYVNARARIMSHNDRVMERGGYRNALPKPQPQGSLRMVYTNSGSNAYGGGMGMTGRGGTFRTKSGAEYGRRKLRERGEQLAEQQIATEEGFPVGMTKPTEPVPLDKEETDIVALDLFFNQLLSAYSQGTEERVLGGEPDYLGDIKTTDINKFFNSLRTTGLKLDLETLQDYFQTLGEVIVDDLRTAPARIPEKDSTAIMRVYYLLTALIDSYNLQPADRKKYIRAQVKQISKKSRVRIDPETGFGASDLIFRDPVQPVPSNLRRLSRGEIKDRLEETEPNAPETILARFVPDPTKRAEVIRDYERLVNEGEPPMRALQLAQRRYVEREGEMMIDEGSIGSAPMFVDDDDEGEAERVVASAVPSSMRPAGVAPAMPSASAPAPAPSERLTASQQKFAEIATDMLRAYLENVNDAEEVEGITQEARDLVPQFLERAKGRSVASLRRLAGEWLNRATTGRGEFE